MRPLLRTLEVLSIAELASVVVLLTNLATVHHAGLAAALGPVHGALYLSVAVSALLGRSRGRGPLDELTPRERSVLGLMAEGRSNTAIAAALFVSEKAVAKHINSIFTKLDLPLAADDNRRVRAVLTWLKV